MTTPQDSRLPITPADPLLPLGDLEWAQFETFCEDYVGALDGTPAVHRYGARGDDQKGIDFYIDSPTGRTTYQCKRHRTFPVSKARSVIAETSFTDAARHVVLVSCEVGSRVRDIFMSTARWEVQDVRDISRNVSISMPRETAERLLGKHFGPEWVRNFFREPSSASGSPDVVLDKYLDWLIAENRELPLPGLPRIGRRPPLALESIYVTLRAGYVNRAAGNRVRHGDPAAPPFWYQDSPRRGDSAASIDLPEAFRKEARLVILGDPGSGKTTALQWLAVRLAKARRTGIADDLGPPRVPILLRASFYLKAWLERGRALRLSAYLGHHLAPATALRGEELDLDALNSALRAALAAGEAVLLLDGLDEVADLKDRYDIAREVDRFLDEWLPSPAAASLDGGNRAVVTSRIVGYSSAELKTDAALMTIAPLLPEAVDDLCRVLITALRRSDHVEGDVADEAEGLMAAVARLRGAGSGDLVSTPLLVTIIALIYHNRRAELPTRRLALYALAVDVLVDRWHERDRVRGSGKIRPEEIRALFASLAAEMLDRSVVRVSESDLEDFLRRRTKGERSIEWLKELMQEDVGLLTAQGEGAYAFLHATFQEYLGASELTGDRASSATSIWEKTSRPRWALAVVMAIAMQGGSGNPNAQTEFVDALLAQDAARKAILPIGALLLIASLAEMESPPSRAYDRSAEELVQSYARNVFLHRPQSFGTVLEDAARLLVRGGGKRSAAHAFHQALRNAEPSMAGAFAVAVARLTAAAHCETEGLVEAILASLPLDSEEWNWPIDAALREVADRSPSLMPRNRDSLRASLLASDGLAETFTSDPEWRRIGLVLYGGLDNKLLKKVAASVNEVARIDAELATVNETPLSPGADARRRELTPLLDAANAHLRSLRESRGTFSIRDFHRESPAITPLILSALSASRKAQTLRASLELLARTAPESSIRVDARLALVALGAPDAKSWADSDSLEGRRTRAALRRISTYIGVCLHAPLKSAAKALEILTTIPDDRLLGVLRILADLAHAYSVNLGLFSLPANRSETVVTRWISEAFRLQLRPSQVDAAYNVAVVLDTIGGALTSPNTRLAMAIGVAPFSRTARWGLLTRWNLDRLAPWPTNDREWLASALDSIEAIPETFDFVRGWAIACLGPLLREVGLAPEALVQLWMSTSPRYGARAIALQSVIGSSFQGDLPKEDLLQLSLRHEDLWLKFRCQTLLLRVAPELRHGLPAETLAELAAAIPDANQRCRAFEALHALEWPGDDWLESARTAAVEILHAENQARAYARLARTSFARRGELLAAAWSAAMRMEPAARVELLAAIREIDPAGESFHLALDATVSDWDRHEIEGNRLPLVTEYVEELERAETDTAPLILAAAIADLDANPQAPVEPDDWSELLREDTDTSFRGRGAHLSTGTADAIATFIGERRNDLAGRLLTIVDRAEPAAERYLRAWLRSDDDRIRRHAGLLLVEGADYGAEAMAATVELLDSPWDRSRFRAAIAVHGDLSDMRPKITTDQVGGETLEVVARAVVNRRPFQPGVTLHLGWMFERVEHSDVQRFLAWVRASGKSGGDGAAARLIIAAIEAVRPAVWAAFLTALRNANDSASPAVGRSLLRGLSNLVAHGAIDDARWSDVWPLLLALDPARVDDDPFFLDPPNVLVDIAETLREEDGQALLDHVAREQDRRRRTVNAEIRRHESDSDGMRRLLADVGHLHTVDADYRGRVDSAAARIVSQPALLGRLVRWLLHMPIQEHLPYYDCGTGDLLAVTAAAAEHLPDLFYDLAMELPDLSDHIARFARSYPSFPARQGAFTLLGLTRHMTAEVVAALRSASRDVFYVQQVAMESLDRYQSVDRAGLANLLEAFQDESPTFAYSCASLLNSLARNSKLDPSIRDRIIAAFTGWIDDPLSMREIHVLTWNARRNEEKALQIEYRGTLRDHLGRWLGELSGVADLVRISPGDTA